MVYTKLQHQNILRYFAHSSQIPKRDTSKSIHCMAAVLHYLVFLVFADWLVKMPHQILRLTSFRSCFGLIFSCKFIAIVRGQSSPLTNPSVLHPVLRRTRGAVKEGRDAFLFLWRSSSLRNQPEHTGNPMAPLLLGSRGGGPWGGAVQRRGG